MDEQERAETESEDVESHKKTLSVTEDEPAPERIEDADVEAHVARQPPTNY